MRDLILHEKRLRIDETESEDNVRHKSLSVCLYIIKHTTFRNEKIKGNKSNDQLQEDPVSHGLIKNQDTYM